MIRKITLISVLIAGGIIGCEIGTSEAPQLYNDGYPNNGAYGPDASINYDSGQEDSSSDASSDSDADVLPACVRECAALQCGIVKNECGEFITCTPCRDNEECVNNLCQVKPPACIPETDQAFCNRFNAKCGEHTGLDNCGKERTVNQCGVCASVCLPTKQCCVPDTANEICQKNNAQCGTINVSNNCGVLTDVNCGLCNLLEVCNNNKCEPVIEPPTE